MDVTIVIGANYGDEGKGLATDYFTHKYVTDGKKVLNILHNGGAQRAHTVELPNGERHVFRHVGSGSFAGADTYMTEEFLVNPIMLKEELETLRTLKCTPKVFIDDYLRITTPYDMMANQILEEARGFDDRLGTCGMGIWETIVRSNRIRFTIQDLIIGMNLDEGHGFENHVRSILTRIRDYYLTWRLQTVQIPEAWLTLFNNGNIMEHFIQDCFWMMMDKQIYYAPNLYSANPQPIWTPYKDYDHIIFENGQGLLLDTSIKEGMEYNTPSHTDLYNPARILKRWCRILKKPVDDVNVVYVSRTYMTRHGKGKLHDEKHISYLESNRRIFDKTNIPNPWQGALRYAPLYYSYWTDSEPDKCIMARIRSSRDKIVWDSSSYMNYRAFLFLTHADEIGVSDLPFYVIPGKRRTAEESLCGSGLYVSYGPRRVNVFYYKTWEDLCKNK